MQYSYTSARSSAQYGQSSGAFTRDRRSRYHESFGSYVHLRSVSLIEHGRAADTPVALVSRGTTDAQEVITGTLDDLADRIEGREIHAPTLIIVGSVVSLHPRYRWFGAADTGGA